jgi:curved DNA-binding protein CbpA
MVAPLILAAVLASPSPAPTSSPPPLKVIVTVHSSSLCSSFATDANAAIGATLQNDTTLGSLVYVLRNPDLRGNPIQRRNMLDHLATMADAIAKQFKAGMAEVTLLRNLESKASDPAEKASLKSAADALGGALYRQHLIGRDLDGFLAYQYAADMSRFSPDGAIGRSLEQSQPDVPRYDRERFYSPSPFVQGLALAGQESRRDDAAMARAASRDFASRLPAITLDEVNAASGFTAAAAGC